MKLVEKKYPGRERRYLKLEGILTEFMKMDVHSALLVFDKNEYTNAISAYGSMFAAAKRYGFPVKPAVRGKNVYLVRTDEEEF